MIMATITATSLTGKNLTINCGWVTDERVIWADGHEVAVPESRFEMEVEIEGIGEVQFPELGRKATERERELRVNCNDTHVITGEVVHQGKRHRVIVQIDDETYEAIKAEMDGEATTEAPEAPEASVESPKSSELDAKVAEAAAAHGLTAEEYRREWLAFVMSEGYHDDGHESLRFGDWLAYRSRRTVQLAADDPQD